MEGTEALLLVVWITSSSYLGLLPSISGLLLHFYLKVISQPNTAVLSGFIVYLQPAALKHLVSVRSQEAERWEKRETAFLRLSPFPLPSGRKENCGLSLCETWCPLLTVKSRRRAVISEHVVQATDELSWTGELFFFPELPNTWWEDRVFLYPSVSCDHALKTSTVFTDRQDY